MLYHSTRGGDKTQSFVDILLSGLAKDGGLFLPDHWPHFSQEDIQALRGKSYPEIAAFLLKPFVGDEFSHSFLLEQATEVYSAFASSDVAPLRKLSDDEFVLELFHGPTLAFKDFALQLLGRFFDSALKQQNRRLTIIGATSGDTGSAAIEALRGLDMVDVFILHPEGKVSDVQRRMMTSVIEPNIHNIAIKGDFDNCQSIVKALFADEVFRDEVSMVAINSINWARIMSQTVYYFSSSLAVNGAAAPVSFVVPTGNFGDIFAGYVAKKMGLPIEKLVIATNSNDILYRTLETGDYEPLGVFQTIAPSMDIQISSNFERLLYEASDRSSEKVTQMMEDLSEGGKFTITPEVLQNIRHEFLAYRADADAIVNMIDETLKEHGYLIDPHTATGLSAIEQAREDGALSGTVISLATAHPAKFPDAVVKACGKEPNLPEHYADLFDRPEKYDVLENDVSAVRDYVRQHLST